MKNIIVVFCILLVLFCTSSCGVIKTEVDKPNIEFKDRVITDTDLHPGIEYA